jgi:O-antigen/teichoic acid export membrane protein
MIFGSVWFNAASEHREVLRVCFLAGGAGLFLNYYAQFWTVLLQAHLEFKFTNLLKTLISLVSIGGSLAMAVLTRSPVWILWWGVAVAAVQLLILIPYSKARFQIGFALSAARLERAREMALFTAKVFLSLITNAVSYSMDRMVVGKLAPAPVFALYTVCANAGSRLHAVGGAMIGPIYHNTNRALGGEQAARAGHIYDEMFTFAFRWYLLIALGLTLWHPILLRLWLGAERGERAAPMFVPLILAFCLMALANISTSQLSSLNRVGSLVGFSIAAGLLAVAGTWVGWHFWGIAGVAYGFLASRACYVLQDFYAIRLLKARGWLSGLIWRHAGMQLLVASIFALVYFFLPRDSIWLLIPASLHGIGVTLWLLRKRLVSWFSSKSSNAFQISHW